MGRYEQIVEMWKNRHVVSAKDIDSALYNFRILFAYNSGKIENDGVTYHDTREIFENGRAVGFTGDPRALFELGNQKLCYEFLKRKITSREPLTIDLVLETHAALAGGTYDERRYVERGERPGAFKINDYMIGREEAGSPPESVRGDIAELLDEMNGFRGEDIIKAAAYFHCKFENIHPFADGNGRVGRTLLNYFLMTRDFPPLIVHEDERAGYYAALESFDRDSDISPMRAFLSAQLERTWEKTLQMERANTDSFQE